MILKYNSSMSKSRKGRTKKTTSLSQKEQMEAYKKERHEYLKKQTQIVKDALESENEDVLSKTPTSGEREPVDDEMLAAVYLTAVNKKNPIDFTEMLMSHRKETETRRYIEHVEELVKPQTKEKYKEEPACKKRDFFVPEEFKSADVEFFLQELGKETIIYEGKEKRILDRTSLPWIFVSKAIAAYVTQILHDEYSLYFAAANMSKVTTFASADLRDLYRRYEERGTLPVGADVVDKVCEKCKMRNINKM